MASSDERRAAGGVLVRPGVPVGVDHVALDARGGAGAAGDHPLEHHVARVPQPEPARGKDLSEEYLQRMEQAWGPVRICEAARRLRGDEVLLPLYTAIGTRFHNDQNRGLPALTEAVAEVGLPESVLEAAQNDELDAAIKESHHRGMDLVGTDVGTPVIAVGDSAFFGPVVTPTPRGEAAGKLWDGVLLVAQTDGFFELKRTRDRRPIFT